VEKPATANRGIIGIVRCLPGRIHDSSNRHGGRTLEVFETREQAVDSLSLFPEDRPFPADAIDRVPNVELSENEV